MRYIRLGELQLIVFSNRRTVPGGRVWKRLFAAYFLPAKSGSGLCVEPSEYQGREDLFMRSTPRVVFGLCAGLQPRKGREGERVPDFVTGLDLSRV